MIEVLEKFVPDVYQKSIYDIDYKKLKKIGIKCLIFDLDNTIAPVTIFKPTKKVRDLFEELKETGFKVLIVSNSHKKRVAPFKDLLCVATSSTCKPIKIIGNVFTYKLSKNNSKIKIEV